MFLLYLISVELLQNIIVISSEFKLFFFGIIRIFKFGTLIKPEIRLGIPACALCLCSLLCSYFFSSQKPFPMVRSSEANAAMAQIAVLSVWVSMKWCTGFQFFFNSYTIISSSRLKSSKYSWRFFLSSFTSWHIKTQHKS